MDLPTRLTIWLALGAYSLSLYAYRDRTAAQVYSSIGWLLFALHVCFAFRDHYQWSHELAVETTAQQTLDVTGIETRLGIYVNYLFGVAWLFHELRSWSSRVEKRHEGSLFWCFHLFVQFMLLNGAIIFAPPGMRFLGVTLMLFNTWWLIQIAKHPGSRRSANQEHELKNRAN